MGLFSKKKESPEELAAKEANLARLENFNVTKAWGVKKYEGAGAMQFAYDGDRKQFVVVAGPMDTFKERNPYVVDFSEVTDVILEVEETWSKDKEEFAPNGYGRLLQNDYKNVYWRYDFFITIKTNHPYAEEIRFKTNFKRTVTKVDSMMFMYRRGYEIGGTYRGAEISELIAKMEKLYIDEAKKLKRDDILQLLDGDHPATVVEAIKNGVKEGIEETVHMKKIDNMTAHVKRAERISRLLLGQ